MTRWILPSTGSFDLLRIVLLSAVVGGFYLYFGSIGVLSGFSNYATWADALLHGADISGSSWLPFRDIGMPLVLLITAYPITHSLLATVALQMAMGIAMPALVYLTLRPWFPRAAFLAGLLSIATLAPYLYSKTLHHDQPFDFFMLLSVWLVSRYGATGKPGQLYALSLSMAALALLRLFAIALYPFMLLCCLAWGGKRPYRHFIGSALVFASCMAAYSTYRHEALGSPPSSFGQQIFLNAYLNSAEYGAKFSADDGPNMRILLAAALAGVQPSPAQAPVLVGIGGPADFMQENFYKYTPEGLLDHMLSEPNMEYYYYLLYATPNDETLVKASLEAIAAHPLYFLRYSWRNTWDFLYNPGAVSPRFSVQTRVQGGLLFPLTGASTAGRGTVGDTLPQPALAEAEYMPLARAPDFIRRNYVRIEGLWSVWYHPVTKFIFVLMLAAWISTLVGLLEKKLARLRGVGSLLLTRSVLAATLPISVMLVLNIGITAILVYPYYRYHDSIVLLKLMLAAVGAAVLARVIRGLLTWLLGRGALFALRGEPEARPASVSRPPLSRRSMQLAWLVLGGLVVAGMAGWGVSVDTVALAAPAPGRIDIVQSGFGENCGVAKNFSLQWVRSACASKRHCNFAVDWDLIGNPAPQCSKEFYIDWTCTPGGEVHRVSRLDPLPGSVIPIACAD